MISQGRIGALVTAKPTDRRAILEEAAGITGLHSRRHEAELRLNATETNLERVKASIPRWKCKVAVKLDSLAQDGVLW